MEGRGLEIRLSQEKKRWKSVNIVLRPAYGVTLCEKGGAGKGTGGRLIDLEPALLERNPFGEEKREILK